MAAIEVYREPNNEPGGVGFPVEFALRSTFLNVNIPKAERDTARQKLNELMTHGGKIQKADA